MRIIGGGGVRVSSGSESMWGGAFTGQTDRVCEVCVSLTTAENLGSTVDVPHYQGELESDEGVRVSGVSGSSSLFSTYVASWLATVLLE